ncbi:hypothetical protein CJ030_MR8G022186 [Morella rubra]|uniref:Uncharacterized protein n=1 Tax=Morella rubra TaxID=262757 RepID=A0A6A1USI9_9ROSI|nr:hypothetical protein CJ030_MR8G022186 [Morella rubra]
MVLEKSVELMLDRHLEEQNVKPPKKVCWYMGGRPASLAPHSSCGEQQIVCRVYAVVWEVVSAEKTHIGNVVVGMIPTKVRASKRLWVLAQSAPTVEPVKNYGSRYSSPPKVEPVKDYGCRWSSPPKVDPVKDYGYKVEPVKDRGYKAEPMKAYAFKPEPEKDYEYKDVQPKDYGYKVGPVKGYDRPQEVEEFITKIQTDASRPNIGPFNAPYRHHTQSSGQNGITGYGDKNDSSSKDWRKPSGNTTRNDNYDDYNRKNDTAVESSMVTTQGWARPSPSMWAAPPTRDTTLGTPKTDIGTAMENFKEAAAKALSVNDAPPKSRYAVPKRDTFLTPPKKDTYADRDH